MKIIHTVTRRNVQFHVSDLAEVLIGNNGYMLVTTISLENMEEKLEEAISNFFQLYDFVASQ